MEARLETLNIAVDGDQLAATLLTPTTLLPGILFVHGWGDSKEQDLERAREMAGIGCVCMTFDLRGHAGTTLQRETVTREDNLRDLVAAYDKFVTHGGVDPASIAVVGISYGGYLATLLSAMRPVRWLALRAPAIYMDRGWELPKRKLHEDPGFKAYRQRELPPDDNRALRACANFDGDVLIVESAHDEIVPHPVIASYLTALARTHSLTARVIEGADHGLSDERYQRAYTTILVGWLTEMIVGARTKAAPPAPQKSPPVAGKRPEDE
jgi:pimeloyl-ACP methyl ester carboxylesterase